MKMKTLIKIYYAYILVVALIFILIGRRTGEIFISFVDAMFWIGIPIIIIAAMDIATKIREDLCTKRSKNE